MGKRKNKKPAKKQITEEYYALSPQTKKAIVLIFLAAFAAVCILSLLQAAGAFGIIIDHWLAVIFGAAKMIFPIILLGIIYYSIWPNAKKPRGLTAAGVFLLYLTISGLLHSKFAPDTAFDFAMQGQGGGLIGYAVSYPLNSFFGFWAAAVIMIAIMAAGVLLILNSTIMNILAARQNQRERLTQQAYEEEDEKSADNQPDEEAETTAQEVNLKSRGLFSAVRAKTAPGKIPAKENKPNASTTEKNVDSKFRKIQIDLPVNLLSKKTGKPRSGDIDLAMERIQTTLSNFGIDVEMDEVSIGPTVTQYTLKPAEGVKVARITSLNNDLALALAAHPIRIEAPIPGKSLIGIEVPNHQPATVGLREIIESDEFKTAKSNLTLALGKDVSGKCWSSDLTKMPHLLVAGATGSGKSVCLNGIIVSLLYQNNPDMLKMILVDPKRVEFPIYNGIPHLLTPVVTNVTKAVNALRWTIQEMDQRFDILAKAGKRNIADYNSSEEDKMPYLVIVIDELADLMIAASNEVEACIIRLTQMARAVGIHLIVATQRPSVDVITGLIKANIPARIAFSVAASMDSRTILDSVGAEKLIGKGDMLFQTAEISKPRRLQGAFIGDDEIKRVVNFLIQAAGEPEYDDAITEKQSGKTSFDFSSNNSDDDNDELLDEAREAVIKAGKASTSYLQRRFRIGYSRAARLIDLLEEHGVVGPADGARPREILANAAEEEPTPTVFKKSEPETDDDEKADEEEIENSGRNSG